MEFGRRWSIGSLILFSCAEGLLCHSLASAERKTFSIQHSSPFLQLHHRDAIAAFAFLAGLKALGERAGLDGISHGAAERPRAFAVNDAHKRQPSPLEIKTALQFKYADY